MSAIRSMKGNRGCEAQGAQLLPGIPDDIVLQQVTPKLSWRAIFILSCVSSGWNHAIRSRQVYYERIRSQSTEALVLLESNNGWGSHGIYVMRDRSYFKLPPIPYLTGGVPSRSQCVSLDGKIYVLGGQLESIVPVSAKSWKPCSDKVFVLDVAGHRQWKECASMKRPREDFGCGVIGGKIYVCGGTSSVLDQDQTYVPQIPCESEVYDPEKNCWSSIKRIISLRKSHRVETVGEELFVHGGVLLGQKYFDSTGKRIQRGRIFGRPRLAPHADFLEIYHPGKDEWRVVDSFKRNWESKFFAAQGKFFSLSKKSYHDIHDIHDIHVLNADQQSWTHLYSFSFAGTLGPTGSSKYLQIEVLPVDGELLAKLSSNGHYVFLRSRGFGREEITWHKAETAPSSVDFPLKCAPFLRCTLNPGENEAVVRYALDTYDFLSLLPQEPRIGGPRLVGGLDVFDGMSYKEWVMKEEKDLVQRFSPAVDYDTIGFFIAKLVVASKKGQFEVLSTPPAWTTLDKE